jgi:hypothetical protein
VRVAMKNVNGVNTVDVSLSKGLATVTLKPGNTVRTKQLLDAISKNGFTTKQSRVEVNGVLVSDTGGLRLKVSGTDENFALVGDGAAMDKARNMVGKAVVVNGTIPEVPKGKLPETLRLNSVEVVKE